MEARCPCTLLAIYCFCVACVNNAHAVSHRKLRGVAKVPELRGALQEWGRARRTPEYMYVLNGYPGKHSLLLHQAEALLAGGGNVTADDLLLTSHVDAVLSSEPLLRTSMIQPNDFCSPPSCNNAEGDGKFLGAALLANATHHGFKWLLMGDDDTTFHSDLIERVLSNLDSSRPSFFAMQVDQKPGSRWYMPSPHQHALERCPSLGAPSELRFSAYNSRDMTDSNGDCSPYTFRDNSWFRWAYGGKGLVLSAGLLDQISPTTWQKCIDRITSFGGDVRISMCLALLGHRVQLLRGSGDDALSEHKLSEEKLLDLHKVQPRGLKQ
mmetsp:Transcript_120782/g.225804  ORF Transcript_120782/g.225804 Transcript_120782/m.225804 type:complete len:324 (+) Transcript_120782:77-1048(+)